MSDAWLVVAAVGAATVAIKAVGPVLAGGRRLPSAVVPAMRLLAPALLAALVVVQVVGGERQIVLDERLVGVGAAVVALRLGAPLLLVVAASAAATALVRLLAG